MVINNGAMRIFGTIILKTLALGLLICILGCGPSNLDSILSDKFFFESITNDGADVSHIYITDSFIFYENGKVHLPANPQAGYDPVFNSTFKIIDNQTVKILSSDTLLHGDYKVEISGQELILTSDRTKIRLIKY